MRATVGSWQGWLVVTVVLALGGCQLELSYEGAKCDKASDCPDGYACDLSAHVCHAVDAGGGTGGGTGGTTDAGAADAGAPDAGVTDAGTTDAGSTDAGPVDAGATDAGSDGGTDAGVADAGCTPNTTRCAAGTLYTCATDRTETPSTCPGPSGTAACAGNGCATMRISHGQGDEEFLFVAPNGAVYGMGNADAGQMAYHICPGTNCSSPVSLGVSGVQSLAQGLGFACGLMSSDHTLWCWGRNEVGQLGRGAATAASYPPSRVWMPNDAGVRQAAGGAGIMCAALENGTAACWGSNEHGRLGVGFVDGGYANYPYPVLVGESGTVSLQGVVEVAPGTAHACARLSSGEVRCWGASNFMGQNLTASTDYAFAAPGQKTFTTGATRVVAGDLNACAIVSGALWCWGTQRYGALGNLQTSGDAMSTNPVVLSGGGSLLDATQVALGWGWGAAVRVDGKLVTWGTQNQLGDGPTGVWSTSPGCSCSTSAVIAAMPGTVVDVTANWHSGMALLSDGRLVTWGDNGRGQLGLGNTTTPQHTPTVVPLP